MVPTKYHLGEYPGHLHIGIEHVRMESPILEGVNRKHDFSFVILTVLSCISYIRFLISFLPLAVKIPAKKTAVEASLSAARKPSTKVQNFSLLIYSIPFFQQLTGFGLHD